mgnify:CR=1 FL=1
MKEELTLKQIEILEDIKQLINETNYNPKQKEIINLIAKPKTKTKKLQSSIHRRMKEWSLRKKIMVI